MSYDSSNIFARILRKELPCTWVAETEHSLAFLDAFPKALTHILIIPKGPYETPRAFFTRASSEEVLDFVRFLGQLPTQLQLLGYRLISNEGKEGRQEVPHFHMHLLSPCSE